jgi:hypothetical protein
MYQGVSSGYAVMLSSFLVVAASGKPRSKNTCRYYTLYSVMLSGGMTTHSCVQERDVHLQILQKFPMFRPGVVVCDMPSSTCDMQQFL